MVAATEYSGIGAIRNALVMALRRVSSAVEQRFCKPLVGSSILSPGTNKIRYFSRFRQPQTAQETNWADYGQTAGTGRFRPSVADFEARGGRI